MDISDVYEGQIVKSCQNGTFYMYNNSTRKYQKGTLFKIINVDEFYVDIIFLINDGPDDKSSIALGCDISCFEAL